jgi:hypothetical protein
MPSTVGAKQPARDEHDREVLRVAGQRLAHQLRDIGPAEPFDADFGCKPLAYRFVGEF